MTKKDYILITNVLKKYNTSNTKGETKDIASEITMELAIVFEKENPRFDNIKFRNTAKAQYKCIEEVDFDL